MFWLFLFIYFLGSKLAEYVLVSGHSISVGRLERPVFGWFRTGLLVSSGLCSLLTFGSE